MKTILNSKAILAILLVMMFIVSIAAIATPVSAASPKHVYPGDSIQAAVNQAGAGGRVHVYAGVYSEAVVITTDGITLKGEEGVILDGTGLGAATGITIRASDVTVQNFEIRNYDDEGVRGEGTAPDSPLSGITLRNLNIHDVGSHAIDILDYDNVRITHVTIAVGPSAPWWAEAIRLESVDGVEVTNADVDGGFIGVSFACFPCPDPGGPTNGVVRGSTFANNFIGVLIAQSTDARILGNTISGAGFAGIRIGFGGSSITGSRISGNELFGNFMGIFGASDGLPTSDLMITNNDVHDNTRDGILLLDTDVSEISGNTVTGNGGNGIALLFDSKGNVIADNTATGNGVPTPTPFILGTADLYHDPSSSPNTWTGNTYGTKIGGDIP